MSAGVVDPQRAFSPGAQVQPYAANLMQNIVKRNLRVDKIVPLHGAIAPFSDLKGIVDGIMGVEPANPAPAKRN